MVTNQDDPFYCGCSCGTNNTGELCGVLNALLWAEQEGGHEPLAICFDSMYAKNITTGVWKPGKNKEIGYNCIETFQRESKRRKGGITFIHVKGHSDDRGNDKADERVQWGKGEGPFCRINVNGAQEGEYIHRPMTSPSITTSPSPSFRFQESKPTTNPKAKRHLNFGQISPIPKTSTPISVPGLLEAIGCRDFGDTILDMCGVLCLGRLSIACKTLNETIRDYNCRTKRIFPVRCGGRDHEFYTFWVSRDRERAEELQTKLDSLERRQITTEAEATDGSNSSRYYHTRLSRNPSSRVNYNER